MTHKRWGSESSHTWQRLVSSCTVPSCPTRFLAPASTGQLTSRCLALPDDPVWTRLVLPVCGRGLGRARCSSGCLHPSQGESLQLCSPSLSSLVSIISNPSGHGCAFLLCVLLANLGKAWVYSQVFSGSSEFLGMNRHHLGPLEKRATSLNNLNSWLLPQSFLSLVLQQTVVRRTTSQLT